jgi:2-polyprenyl-3-methyl-5-hydroxy-6-metoxy-1,4-benzoquinol methylase
MEGYGDITDKLRARVNEGYSVIVFPEGSRSADSSITRFHKGAFLMAHKLGLDVLPVIIHGAGDCMNKGENHLRGGSITVKIFPRIKPGDASYGADYHEMKNNMLRFFRNNYALMKEELENPAYFRRRLIRNYIYKGPVIEWYTRIKLSLENNYSQINEMIPRNARITDIGCGYGYLSRMLGFVAPGRRIIGYDYDADKIELASGCISVQPNVEFRYADVTTIDLDESDVFVLSDVLHYLKENEQDSLISNCMAKLAPGGKIIIRDADRDLKKRHKGTRYTEFFSTRSGFNKAENNRLYFFSGSKVSNIAERNGFTVKIFDHTRLTSNILYVLEKEYATTVL